MCNNVNPKGTLGVGEVVKPLECRFEYTITQDDIESLAKLLAKVAFNMFYYSCPEKTAACKTSVNVVASKGVPLVKAPAMSEPDVSQTVGGKSSAEYSAVGGESQLQHALCKALAPVVLVDYTREAVGYFCFSPTWLL
jgi:hypothetical protein